MFRRIADWLNRRAGGRPFEAFQVEVTTRCLLRCAMCPRVALADRWPEMDIPRRFDGQSLIVPRLRFGNVLEQDLLDIWNSPAYRAFREQAETRSVR